MKKGITLPNEDWLKNHTESYRITTNGDVETIAPEDGEAYTLEEAYKHCGCDLIDCVYLPEGRIMICDDEGALKANAKVNWIATKIIGDVIENNNNRLGFFIYGNVMIVKDEEFK